MNRERLGERIKRRRQELHISLRDAAKRIGVSASYLSKVECDVIIPPTEEKLTQLAVLLQDDVDELMCLADRVPQDVKEVIAADPKMTALLRTVRDQNVSAAEMLEWLQSRKPKEAP